MPKPPILLNLSSFLEFLRNLTPQVLLTSASIFMSSIYAAHPHSIKGWLAAVLCGLLILILITAILANMWQFLDNVVESRSPNANEPNDALEDNGLTPGIWNALAALYRKVKTLFIEEPKKLIALLMAVSVVYASLIAVLITSINNTLKVMS